jgi:hypothetical protein
MLKTEPEKFLTRGGFDQVMSLGRPLWWHKGHELSSRLDDREGFDRGNAAPDRGPLYV